MAKNSWTPIALTPLTGMLDTRSRPAETVAGTFRYKLNLSVNRTGSLCSRSGYQALDLGLRSDDPAATPNWDFHRRGQLVRNPPTFLFENTAPDGVKRLFAGTQATLDLMDNDTSEWTNLVSGDSDASWKAASLEDRIVFTDNNTSGLYLFDVNTLTLGGAGVGFTWHAANTVTRARVATTFSDVVMLMNVDQNDGGTTNHPSRIWWSDYKEAEIYTIGGASVAGFQDLDYGDEILAAAEMMGALYVFTTRSIWRVVVNITPTTIFAFQKIYSEPKNQAGCLRYANTLVTTGRELYWWSEDSIWTFNPYIVAPECPEWLLKGSGALFSSTNSDRMEKRCCDSIVGEYHPETKEIWYSYPQGFASDTPVCVNNRCMVLNVEYKTMDIVDAGFTAFVNFRLATASGDVCNSDQVFIGAANADYCLKSIGDVFYRENVEPVGGSKSNEIPDQDYELVQVGYYSRIVGMCPFGYPNQKKIVREFLLDAEIGANTLTDPNLLTLRIGNSFALEDPMSEGDSCAVMWHDQESIELTCPNPKTIAAMLAAGENPSDPLSFYLYEEGNRLYFDLKITNSAGAAPVEHNVAFSAFRFEVRIA